jgi:hypothetical protein
MAADAGEGRGAEQHMTDGGEAWLLVEARGPPWSPRGEQRGVPMIDRETSSRPKEP